MLKNYKFPINIFLIFEKLKLTMWTSNVLIPNHYVIFINGKHLYQLNILLRRNLFFSDSSLIDASAVDTNNFNAFFMKTDFFLKKNTLILYYLYYFFYLKTRITFVFLYNQYKHYSSIDKLFRNANWLEREFCEFFNVFLFNKTDSRKLLLDYSKNENPLLKEFPVEGYSDVFYNFFDETVNFISNDVIEL